MTQSINGTDVYTTVQPLLAQSCGANSDNVHEKMKRIVLIPLSILIIASNGVVLFFVAIERKFHRPTYWFVTSLGIADTCVGIVSIGTIITKANEATLDLCLVRIGFTISSIHASTMCILGVAVDRYIAITRALRYSQIMTTNKVGRTIVWIVMQSLLVGFVPLMGWNNGVYEQYCSFLYVLSPGYVIFMFIIALVPIITVFLIYIKLYCSARGHIKRIDALEQLGFSNKHNGLFGLSTRNWKSVKTLLFVIGCLLITWCPFLIATAVELISGDGACFLKEIVGTHLLMLGFSNSFLNPLIYAVRTRDFRDNLRDTVRTHCCA